MVHLADGMDRILGEGALQVLKEAHQLEQSGKRILHFEIGQPDFPTPDNIKRAGIQAIEDGFTRYTLTTGIPELKHAIQDEIELTRFFRPDLDQIAILPGAKTGIYLSMIGICNPKDEIIYPDPGFPTYHSLCRYIRAKPVPIRLREENRFRMSPEDIANEITSKTKMIILNSPQNPTGSVMTKEELNQVAVIAEENDCFILSDEIYSKLVYDIEFSSATSYDGASERSILLDGFSKSYSMTGWRLGYLVGPRFLVEKLETLMVNAFTCTSEFIQMAGITALKGPQDDLMKMRKIFQKRRDVIVDGLNQVPGFSCQKSQGAFYAWPNITETGLSSKEMAHYLLHEAGISCLPGTAFGVGGEGYLRFSYATSMETIVEAIKSMKEAAMRAWK
ncbi:MAG: pyridoxal phosphate-dependent aminotransferase [Candidatus Thorarchaeota archaeon]|nr:pyridoxal phosphate-dependent aminotransferase [Candidatus Thorarchaeota archaeon]